MVGVAYMIIVFSYLSGFVDCAEKCPANCPCLGLYVDCSQKGFINIPADVPKWTKELNLRNNNIKVIDGTGLKFLYNLTKLELNKNKISLVTKNAFNYTTRLKVLDLNRNRLKTIEALTFKRLSQINELNLKRNNISDLQDGAFFGLEKIETLSLDYNSIEVIRKSWLFGLGNLNKMSLSNNMINSVEIESWEMCKNLIELNLAFNNIKTIKKDTFLHLGDLQKLNLNNNNINYVEDGSFSSTTSLKTLHLSNNKIHFTIEDATGVFKGLSNLEKFYIASNNIKSIKKNAFSGLSNVIYLDLNHNNITSVQKNAFSEMPLLKVLIMNTSSLLCDCNLVGFYDWLTMEKKLKPHSRAICAYPEWLRNQPLLNVPANNFTCDQLVKPRLIEQPDAEIMALKGENVSLSCKAMSSSPMSMSFHWKKDSKNITSLNILIMGNSTSGKNTESVSVLNIFGVQQSDSGKYQCIVSNSFGTTYSQKCSISVLIYPQFAKIPMNVTAQSGKNVRLECGATGHPKPEIAWHKDGGNDFPAARERRMHVMTDDDVFFILNVKPVDMGVYSCTAHNPAGTIVANATVTVEEMPFFSKLMEDREVNTGESVVLKCMAGGHPKPSIQWLKNGEPIHPTERHFFTAEDQLMIIIDAVLKDAGTYQCMLNNSLGISNGSSELVVKPGIMESERMEIISDKMGIIIITVVCCAVATSIVWVVIIYQTRKRMRPQNSNPTLQDTMIMEFTEKAINNFGDNTSDHSSCKDSGTGDSAKRSNDDLLPGDEYTLIINSVNSMEKPTSMRAASLVYVPTEGNNSYTPLLHSDCPTYPRSTNHDRLPESKQVEVVVIEKYPTESIKEG